MDHVASLPSILQKFLLSCGIIAPLIYLGTDWLAGRRLKGYSFKTQSMSELSAAGSPTRSLVVSLTLVASVMMSGFGAGVWNTANQAILARIVGGLLIGHAAAGLVAAVFFPTRFGERPQFVSANVLVMFASVVFFMLAIVFGAVAFRGWFRIFSSIIPVAYILLAVLRFATASSSSVGEASSLIGAQERTMAYSFLLWVLALAIHLLLLFNNGADLAGALVR